MANKRKTPRRSTTDRALKKRASGAPVASSQAEASSSEIEKAEAQFKRGLLIRGDAAYVDQSGKLPLDATHEIVEKRDDGDTSAPDVKRVRLKLW